MVEEKNDADDRRSKRLKLTAKGEKVFHESVESVNRTSRLLSGKLDKEEREELLKLLKKLNEFHSHLYHEYRNSAFNDMIQLL
jgi:DNA-binding MarR family transcriptional regulator